METATSGRRRRTPLQIWGALAFLHFSGKPARDDDDGDLSVAISDMFVWIFVVDPRRCTSKLRGHGRAWVFVCGLGFAFRTCSARATSLWPPTWGVRAATTMLQGVQDNGVYTRGLSYALHADIARDWPRKVWAGV